MFEWSDSYSVGVHRIDSQHKKLFRLAADFHRAVVSGESKTTLPELLDRLVQLTEIHFVYEERLLQEAGYPEFLSHKLEHNVLRQKLAQGRADFQGGGTATMPFELLRSLKDAIRQHILGSDQQYALYLKRKAKSGIPVAR